MWSKWSLPLLLGAAACDPTTVDAVGIRPGVYQPGAGCTVTEGGGRLCPVGRQLGFETAGDPGFAIQGESGANVANPRTSCERSFCGSGALTVRARYRWTAPNGGATRLGTIVHKLTEPVDLLGKELSFKVSIRQLLPDQREGASTPINGQIAITSRGGRYRIVADGPLPTRPGWHTMGGLVIPENDKLGYDDRPTSIVATEIHVQIYLSVPVTGGDVWEADLFFDEIGWE
jgi:hypothetical protein